MPIQYVNTGSSSNKGDGDSIRLAFTKVNNNFSQLSGFFVNTGTASFFELQVTGSADISNLISNTGTFQEVYISDILSVGTYLGFDDSQIIKNKPGGLSQRLLNTFPQSNSSLIFSDWDQGNFIIGHQNSGSPSFNFPAGGNFIFSDNPSQSITIGLYSDIDFYASEAKWFNPLLSIVPSLSIKNSDGRVVVNKTMETIDIVPKTNLTYDLGSPSKQWRSLYVGTSTIYLGGTALSVSGGNLTVGGAPVVGGSGVTSPYDGVFVITNTTTNTTSDTGALVVAGGVGIGGNIHVQGYGHFGLEPTIVYTNPLAVFTADADDFTQVAVQNKSTGTSASSDIVLTTDDGTDELYFINMGINNSNYSSESWTISGPHDGYLYVSNGNLTLGTTEPATYVKVHIGGTIEGNVVATFREPGTDSTSSFTGALTVDGGIGITGQMHLQETLHVGGPNLNLTNAVFIGARYVDNYVQLAVQNEHPGANASSDFIATADNGDDFSKYIDLGINSSGYNNPNWTISGANDGYLYINSGSLTLGTDSTGTTVKIHVGGTLDENVVATFSETTLAVNTLTVKQINNTINPPSGDQVSNVRYWDSAGLNLYVWFNAAETPEIVTLGSLGNLIGWTVSVDGGNSATITDVNPAGFFSISTDVALTGVGTLTFTSPGYIPVTPNPINVSVASNIWTFKPDGGLIFPDGTTSTGATVFANSSSYKIQTISFGGSPSNVVSTFEFGVASMTIPGNGIIYNEGQEGYWALDGANKQFTFPNSSRISYGLGNAGLTVDDLKIQSVNTGNVVVSANGEDWIFSTNGSLAFPDFTVQTTAYRFVTPPASSTSTGVAGSLAQDASYFYVCTATNSWKRIAWNTAPW